MAWNQWLPRASEVSARCERQHATYGRGAVLLLGNWRVVLPAARQLSWLGFRVVLGSEPDVFYADHSRFVDQIWHCPKLAAGSDDFRQALLGLLDRTPDLRVVIPTRESALVAIAAMEAELKGRVRLAMPSAHVIAICHDKGAWLQFARSAGVRCPPFGVASDLPQLAALSAEIGYPVVIRPAESGRRLGMRKAVTLFDDRGFTATFSTWPRGLSKLLVQRRFEGGRYNVNFAAQGGRIIREQHTRSLRTDRADGSGQTIEGVGIAPIPTLSSELEKVVRQMSYTGVGNAQFLFDPASGTSCFLEINPRFGAGHAFVEKVGMELTRLAIELADGDAEPLLAKPYAFDEGTRYVSTFGDLAGLTFSLTNGEVGPGGALRWLGTALRAAVRADVHVTWSWRDPLPAITVPSWHLMRWFTKAKAMPGA